MPVIPDIWEVETAGSWFQMGWDEKCKILSDKN
jgi:hypothetical protein